MDSVTNHPSSAEVITKNITLTVFYTVTGFHLLGELGGREKDLHVERIGRNQSWLDTSIPKLTTSLHFYLN